MVYLDEAGPETAGDRALHVLDLQRDLAHLLGQSRHDEAQPCLGVNDPGEQRNHDQYQ